MAITIDKVDDGLPISVIVPLSKKREHFFYNITLPLIEANNPAEIIINDNPERQGKKRNDCLDKATQEYVFFCDDDIILPANLLENMYNKLEENKYRSNARIGYAYCGYKGIVIHAATHPMKGNFDIKSRPFDPVALRRANYISPMSLFVKDWLVKFDEELTRLEDWDLYLTLLDQGIIGVEMPNDMFYAFYLDEGTTSNNNDERSQIIKILKKHNVGI